MSRMEKTGMHIQSEGCRKIQTLPDILLKNFFHSDDERSRN